ncbi:Thiamin pyrophosphokinase, catalytic domain/Thiamin pyrophosphokinase, vitamin B1 binding domain containing protein, putative [Angomonas deanei]|uniref:Thiamin pyrophosphokinase, catalytic domain/Thiamin pyrophosphokinase, vitamin B1 binding domain containing protein, putative n=1 Tax=Angomonas deanei TaxID=59799 RepID=A0A7G2CKN1_9TRYP|nr:Thiamin pyrophosphokinase, catalytic domain/Thiamin pyrophosphokinase, vitamin B1 binding domain containing protein, putative [Angomonas deanei]
MKKVFHQDELSPSAVILLNSPDNGQWDFEQYMAHYKKRSQQDGTLFICADGSYRVLLDYYRKTYHPAGEVLPILCDVIIGDMDSETSLEKELKEFCTTVDTCPTVEDVKEEWLSDILATSQGVRSVLPLRIPVECQMTTDFQKCVKLFLLLQAKAEKEGQNVPSQSIQSTELVVQQQSRYKSECDALSGAEGHDSPTALDLKRMNDLMERSVALTAVQLPSVLVFGALGGRLDHEIAAFCCASQYSQEVNLVLLNQMNVVVACWPDGVTEWITTMDSRETESKQYCGIVPFGVVQSLETAGLLYNIVYGHPDRYDGVTQTSTLDFSFKGMVSTCNEAIAKVVTIDLTPVEGRSNPPTLLMCSRRDA